MARATRPIFLNLMQRQMPVGALTSIGHRLTGVLLAMGVPLNVYFLYLSLHSEQTFAAMMRLLSYPAIKSVVFVLVWTLAHHFLTSSPSCVPGVGKSPGAGLQSDFRGE